MIAFLTIVYQAIESLVTDLMESCHKLEHYVAILEKHLRSLPEIENQLLFIIIQNSLFSDEAISLFELKRASGKSDTWIRKYLTALEEEGFITKGRNGHSMVYAANFDALDGVL